MLNRSDALQVSEIGSFHVGGRRVTLSGLPIRDLYYTDSAKTPLRIDQNGDYFVEQRVENGDAMLQLRLESLTCDEELFGFALTLEPATATNGGQLEEGDAVVYRKQWHEIKNAIGALKLYGTFLTRKLPEGDERETVEKMLTGINGLIDYLAKIRRGETK